MNVQRSLHPQYHDWGALEQGPEPPTAPRVLQHKRLPTAPGVCSLRCVFTLDGLNAEHKFWVWVTILGCMSRHFHFLSVGQCTKFVRLTWTCFEIFPPIRKKTNHMESYWNERIFPIKIQNKGKSGQRFQSHFRYFNDILLAKKGWLSIPYQYMKHSSHRSHFQTKQLFVGQFAKFVWPTGALCEISFTLIKFPVTWIPFKMSGFKPCLWPYRNGRLLLNMFGLFEEIIGQVKWNLSSDLTHVWWHVCFFVFMTKTEARIQSKQKSKYLFHWFS